MGTNDSALMFLRVPVGLILGREEEAASIEGEKVSMVSIAGELGDMVYNCPMAALNNGVDEGF